MVMRYSAASISRRRREEAEEGLMAMVMRVMRRVMMSGAGIRKVMAESRYKLWSVSCNRALRMRGCVRFATYPQYSQ